jgi:HAD superfamily hydrolase (TIGR01509 family)
MEMLNFVPSSSFFQVLPTVQRGAVNYIQQASLQQDQSSSLSSTALLTSTAIFAAIAATVSIGLVRNLKRRSRLILGPTGGCWYEYRYKAKAGAKYRYRLQKDKYEPEFGVKNEEEGRLIRFGELCFKGRVRMPVTDDDDIASAQGELTKQVKGALLLDCDGTIAETERDVHRVAFNKAFKEKGYEIEWDVDLYGQLLTTGGGKERIARYFTEVNPGAWIHADPPSKSHPSIVELHELKTELFQDIVNSGEIRARDGIKEMVTAAASAGWKLAVCSTSNEAAVRAVVKATLPEFYSKITFFAGDVVAKKKPDPAIYQLAAKQLGVAPMKCVVVEDTEIGAQAGKAAGMKVVVTKSIYSADEDFSAADVVVDSASDVDFTSDVATLLPTLQLA